MARTTSRIKTAPSLSFATPVDDVITGPPTTFGVSFDFTGAPQTWTVPPGVTQVRFSGSGAGTGQRGAYLVSDHIVTPNEQLYIMVGGTNHRHNGGWNGGGDGGSDIYDSTVSVSGGAGATDVRTVVDDLTTRIYVAGGASPTEDGGGDVIEVGETPLDGLPSTRRHPGDGLGGGTPGGFGGLAEDGDDPYPICNPGQDGALGQGGAGAEGKLDRLEIPGSPVSDVFTLPEAAILSDSFGGYNPAGPNAPDDLHRIAIDLPWQGEFSISGSTSGTTDPNPILYNNINLSATDPNAAQPLGQIQRMRGAGAFFGTNRTGTFFTQRFRNLTDGPLRAYLWIYHHFDGGTITFSLNEHTYTGLAGPGFGGGGGYYGGGGAGGVPHTYEYVDAPSGPLTDYGDRNTLGVVTREAGSGSSYTAGTVVAPLPDHVGSISDGYLVIQYTTGAEPVLIGQSAVFQNPVRLDVVSKTSLIRTTS